MSEGGFENHLRDSRGWSVKYGRRRHLTVPKRGKAALRAERQGQGQEVLRGRSAFKKRQNGGKKGCRCQSPEYCACGAFDKSLGGTQIRRYKLRKAALRDARDMLQTLSGSIGMWCRTLDDLLDDLSVSSAERGACEPSRWDLAVVNANHAAALYQIYLRERGPSSPDPPNEEKRQRTLKDRERRSAEETLERKFLRLYGTHLTFRSKTIKTDFEQLCRKFITEHGEEVCQSLRKCFRGHVQLTVAPLHPDVQRSFLDVCNGELQGILCPAFHGTDATNLPSIYKNGLLIPGVGNSLQVAHGSTHGLGIYTAKMCNPGLSFGFCDGNRSLLVCGVVDDAPHISHRWGRYTTHFTPRRSDEVLHVGDAIVIFNNKRVAPLFVAQLYGRPELPTMPRKLPVVVQRRRARRRRPAKKPWQFNRKTFGVGCRHMNQ